MDWDQQQQQQQEEVSNGSMFVKVMTDEQMEILRNQIAAYATICQQLVDLHKKSLSSPHQDLTGSLTRYLSLFLYY